MKKSTKLIAGYLVFTFLFASTAFVIVRTSNQIFKRNSSNAVSHEIDSIPQIVIDSGHGGEDGGASNGDYLEKHLNLDISLTLSDLFTLFGYDAILTRRDDSLLYDYFNDLEDYTGKKKTYDLKNRLRIAEESGAEIYIGVHMNKFPKEQYKGLQVYYSPNTKESETAAQIIQSYAKKYLMPENNREIKCANQSIYILKRITIPAVLVECGFLSNPEELALLSTREYRNKVALSVFSSSTEFLTQN